PPDPDRRRGPGRPVRGRVAGSAPHRPPSRPPHPARPTTRTGLAAVRRPPATQVTQPMNWLRDPEAEPIPGYRLIEPIGTGGFGEVWKCVAPGGIHKAIKFVYGNLNSLDGDDVRAQQEKKALERVKEVRHPFVLSIEQIQEVGGELVIVMELADKNLHELLVEYQNAGRPGIPRDVLIGLLDDAAIG